MRYLVLSLLICLSISATAEETKPVKEIRHWLIAPDVNKVSYVFEKVNLLDDNEVIDLVRSMDKYAFTVQFMLIGIVARFERFGLISKECLDNSSDVEKAACIAALREWKGQRGNDLSAYEKKEAINLLSSKNHLARKLIVLTVLSTDYYSTSAFKTLIEILEMDLSNQPYGNETKLSIIQILEVLTDRDTRGINDVIRIGNFKTWLYANEHRLKPSKLSRKKRTIYTNYLHRFSLEFPLSYKRINNPQYVKGKRCIFADNYGRSIAVETHPKFGGVELAFEEVKRNSEAMKYKEVHVGYYPAIMYKINSDRGIFIGLLVEIEDRTILATGYSPFNWESYVVEELLRGLSIL
jgi:hypothetical protein